MIRNKKAGFMLGALELLAAFEVVRIWTISLETPTADQFIQVIESISVILGAILMLLPIIGLLLVFRNRRGGYLMFAAFPLLSIIFGITALPFVSYFYGKDVMLNSLFIAIINALICAFAFWLFVSAKSHYPDSVDAPASEKIN